MTIDEREWETQERALRAELSGGARSAAEHELAEYRVVIKAIRSQPIAPVPPGFSADTARKVRQYHSVNDGLEYRLLCVLLTSMAALSLWGLVSLVHYLSAMPASVAASILSWAITLAACFGVTNVVTQFARSRN